MNQPLDTFVVEDDIRELKVLTDRLKPALFNVFKSSSFEQAMELLKAVEMKFNLSIFDIQLGPHKCYDIIDAYGKERFGLLCYTMLVHSIDPKYLSPEDPPFILLKPHNKYSVDDLLDRVTNYLIKLAQRNGVPYKHHFFYNSDKNLFLDTEQIVMIRASDDYARIFYFEDEELKRQLIDNNLKGLQRFSETEPFWKCHKYFIINKHYIDFILQYKDDSFMPVSSIMRIKTRWKKLTSK